MNPSATKPKASTTVSAQAAPIPEFVPNIQAARRIDYDPAVYEVKQYRRELAEAGLRRARRTDFGEQADIRNRCLISGLPLEHGQTIRVLVLARDELNHDADPRSYRRVERWLPVGLPLRTRYRFGDDGFFPPVKDVAWQALREYFQTRYGVRLQHRDLQRQLAFNARLVNPSAHFEATEPLAVFDFAYVLEEAYRWLVATVGQQREESGQTVRSGQMDYVRRWVRSTKANQHPAYRPDRPFREEANEPHQLLAACGIESKSATADWNEPVARYLPPCCRTLLHPFGALALGPVLHQILRGNGAATRALCDANLCVEGLGELREPLRPTWISGTWTHRFPFRYGAGQQDDFAWLLRRRAKWILRQPVAKPLIGLVR